MDNNWVLCQFVKVGNGLDEDGGCGGDGNEFAGAYGLEYREQRVGIIADRKDLIPVSI
jgi:hypothetical protein